MGLPRMDPKSVAWIVVLVLGTIGYVLIHRQ
jgi:hypothetical protein